MYGSSSHIPSWFTSSNKQTVLQGSKQSWLYACVGCIFMCVPNLLICRSDVCCDCWDCCVRAQTPAVQVFMLCYVYVTTAAQQLWGEVKPPPTLHVYWKAWRGASSVCLLLHSFRGHFTQTSCQKIWFCNQIWAKIALINQGATNYRKPSKEICLKYAQNCPLKSSWHGIDCRQVWYNERSCTVLYCTVLVMRTSSAWSNYPAVGTRGGLSRPRLNTLMSQ